MINVYVSRWLQLTSSCALMEVPEAPSLAVPPALCDSRLQPALFKWAKLRSGGECKSCLVWVCELQRDFSDIHRGYKITTLSKLKTASMLRQY